MCGIYFSISQNKPLEPTDEHLLRLQARGPNSVKSTTLDLICVAGVYHVHCISTVLSLRGDGNGSLQPLIADHADVQSRSVLCWNGEAYSFGSKTISGHDTSIIFDALLLACRQDATPDSDQSKSNCAQVLRTIRGPFAFVFVDGLNGRLFYGRDCLGRRSLVFRESHDALTIASVGDEASSQWREIDSEDPVTGPASLSGSYPLNDCPGLDWHFKVNTDLPTSDYKKLSGASEVIQRLELELRRAVAIRVDALKPVLDDSIDRHKGRIAVLFSGGIDCTLLARLIHDYLPTDEPIDLLNVAFENPRIHGAAGFKEKGIHFSDACPDRMTALSSLSELRSACPSRHWRLLRINVPYAETEAHRDKIMSLMAPHDTEMDLSIATALYFAARGEGHVSNNTSDTPHTTNARVLFSGLGADELFGGYARHEQAFKRGGYRSLVEELQVDVSRLGKRNLGRDDRVLSHWGRETRFPYLDEAFVDWAVHLPVWKKTGFGLDEPPDHARQIPYIEDGKLLIRLLSARLGLPGAAREKKRAIQFGARTAKMQSGRSKGTDSITSTQR